MTLALYGDDIYVQNCFSYAASAFICKLVFVHASSMYMSTFVHMLSYTSSRA